MSDRFCYAIRIEFIHLSFKFSIILMNTGEALRNIEIHFFEIKTFFDFSLLIDKRSMNSFTYFILLALVYFGCFQQKGSA